MADFGKRLLAVLEEIKGTGSFVCRGVQPFLFPGLEIRDVEEIGFPINASQIKEMIAVAQQAPFGKGSRTVLDTKVRRVWEIEDKKIKFTNKAWGNFVEGVVEKIKPALGLDGISVSANLYKLLIYERGDFFLPHKDSEKENGMFGSLIIGLPSKHSGGELAVRFDGREEVVDFSEAAGQYKIPYAAFYADCEHEIKPVTSGYRVCLVYNLVQKKGAGVVRPQPLGDYVAKLTTILKASEKDRDFLKIVLLGHQYTPSNFTMGALKLNDRLKAQSLLEAAKEAGFYVKLGLVTSYQVGELEVNDSKKASSRNSRRNSYYYDDYYDDEDLTENGTMGEVYDSHVGIEHWMVEGIPPWRNIEFDEMDLITPDALNEGEPVEKKAEGYTGNAGMEMQYWYHYGAVFLWPRKQHYRMVTGLELKNQLEWVDYYNRQWRTLGDDEIEIVKKLVGSGLRNNSPEEDVDASPLADLLININDGKYLADTGVTVLANYFAHISVDKWIRLLEKYPANYFENVFATADKGKISTVNKLTDILAELGARNIASYMEFVMDQTQQLPHYLEALKLTIGSEKAMAKNILRNLIQMDGSNSRDRSAWLGATAESLTKELTAEYVNEVLVDVILKSGKRADLAIRVLEDCKGYLKRKVQHQPKPPADWSRPIPRISGDFYKDEWNILADFLKSPTLQVLDFQATQAKRTAMEHAVRSVTIDIKMETIRKGSPHTLRLVKTQDAYLRELAKWKKDVELLKKVELW